MSSSDRSGIDDAARPAKPGGAAAGSPEDGDESVLVIRIEERQLMWIAVTVLAVFVVINGFAILTRDSSGAQPFQPPPFEGGSYPEPPAGSEHILGGAGSEGKPTPAPEGADKGWQERAPRSEGGFPNNDSMELVRGEEALRRVGAFATDFDLGKEDADALLAVVQQTNAAIEILDGQLASGEIERAAYATAVQQQQENQRQAIVQILGWQHSSNLHERLRSSSADQPSGTPPATSP